MQELQFQVIILDPKSERRVQGAVAFGDFEVQGNEGVVYPKDGLRAFFEDLIRGRPLPLTFVTNGVDTIGTLVALTVFLHRDLAILPSTVSVLASAELVDRYKHAGLAHVDRDLARFFAMLSQYLPSGMDRAEQETRLASAVGWIRQYILDGTLPALPHEPPMPRVIDRGTNGFVLADTPAWRSLEEGWVELFRQGFLRGVLFGRDRHDRRAVMAARKSPYLAFDLRKAAEVLNEAERAMGEEPAWLATDLWLRGPDEGTLLLATAILEVLLRV